MKKHRIKKREEGLSYWQSYSDMMAALLLVFVLILTVSMLKSKNEMEIETQKLETQQQLYEEQKEQLKKQQELFEEQAEKIKEQEERLDKIVGVKSDIIAALRDEFASSNLEIKIDSETGTITFESDLLFDANQYYLKNSSKKFLDDFLPRYFSVLMSDKFVDNVAEIIIEGHTAKIIEGNSAKKDTYMNNLTLSQNRAFAVAEYALRDDTNAVPAEKIEDLRTIVTVNGRSFNDPVYNEAGEYDMAGSRRVEIKFRLKDDEMVQEMINILNGEG